MAKHYDEIPVEQWNVRHFHNYFSDLHVKKLGVSYQPGGGWRVEQGLIGDIIGTQKKAAKYDKALIKEFMRRGIEEYRPRPGYPGVSFMWLWTYRKNVLQELELEYKRKQAAANSSNPDDLEEDWF